MKGNHALHRGVAAVRELESLRRELIEVDAALTQIAAGSPALPRYDVARMKPQGQA
jgi:hypothetical protein